MVAAYVRLHEAGHAHSIETWIDGELAGGLYGVGIGRAFFGESMFATRTDASKIALVHLVRQLERWGFGLIDCQMKTDHLASLGATEIPRRAFVRDIERLTAIGRPDRPVEPRRRSHRRDVDRSGAAPDGARTAAARPSASSRVAPALPTLPSPAALQLRPASRPLPGTRAASAVVARPCASPPPARRRRHPAGCRPRRRDPVRIEDYALLGDTQTPRSSARDGSIDWLCVPRFDSGACFAALLGTPRDGRWLLAPSEPGASARRATATAASSSTPSGPRRPGSCG